MNFKNLIKTYIDNILTKELKKRQCFYCDDITDEDRRRLLYYIEFSDEILNEYGSYNRWKYILEKDNMKPYMYYIFKE